MIYITKRPSNMTVSSSIAICQLTLLVNVRYLPYVYIHVMIIGAEANLEIVFVRGFVFIVRWIVPIH